MVPLSQRYVAWVTVGVVVSLVVISIGCTKGTSATTPATPPVVEVATVEQRDVPIYSEWIGTLDGLVNADIKAEVSGYLQKQDYMEGAFVEKGQVLFEIDPRPFEAAVDEAKGHLAQANGQLAQARAQYALAVAQVAVAEANQGRTQLDVDRYTPLAKQEAITQQDLDNATQNNLAAKAQLQAAKAQVETANAQIEASQATVQSSKAALATAELNLGFTKLTAPVQGIAGQAQEQVGALVSPSSGPVTTVSTLDPIKVYITVSEQEYLDFHRRYNTQASVDAERKQLRLELIFADGTVYPSKGTFFFADRQVNLGTGSIRVAGLFPNPGSVLRPGQYAKIRTSIRTKQGALLVPQRAVTELQGVSQVAIVGNNNQIAIRNVKPGERIGNMWIVDEGLKPGDLVVAEGTQKVRPGMVVAPKPFAATASVAER
jgi:membrane fusion protein (multidrug efflux system)